MYNKLIRKKHRQFKGKMLSGLLESEKKNPKEFWNSVNELMEKQKSDPSADISPEKWVDYFKEGHSVFSIGTLYIYQASYCHIHL